MDLVRVCRIEEKLGAAFAYSFIVSFFDTSASRTLHRYCKRKGFKPQSSLNVFQGFFSHLPEVECRLK